MPDTPLHPETPREIALCRMACDEMITMLSSMTSTSLLNPFIFRLRERRDAFFPLPKKRVPRVLTRDDGSEWTFDGDWWRLIERPELGYPNPTVDGHSLTASELRRAADVRENPWTEGEA